MRDGAIPELGRPLIRLHRLPIHLTPIARKMLEPMAAPPSVKGFVLRFLLDPLRTDRILAKPSRR